MSLRLKVVGGGHSVELSVADTPQREATVLDIKTAVQQQTGLPIAYQKLVTRGRSFDDDRATAASVGLCDRTKIMLMHSEAYAADKPGYEALEALAREVTELETNPKSLSSKVVDELCTQLCCKLDGVAVGESEMLRGLRRALLQRCERLSSTHGS